MRGKAPTDAARTPAHGAFQTGAGEDPGPGLRSTFIEVGGFPIHSVVSTQPPETEYPPIVLVHGLALSGRYMLPTARALLPYFRVHVPDLPGFGDSGKPRRVLDVPQLADALSAWMQAAGLERAMLLGNSFGCQIIADLAARHPHQVERGVLQGPTTPPSERSRLRQFIRWRQNSPYVNAEMDEISFSDYAKCGIVRALLTFDLGLRDRIEDKLPHVQAPMLVVRGELDPIVDQSWAQAVADRLPQGRLKLVPDAAHTMVFMSPGELAAASLPFLRESRAARERGSGTDPHAPQPRESQAGT